MVAPLVGAATSAVGNASEYTAIVGNVLNGLFDMILTAVPTAYDKARKVRMKDLTARRDAGELGLTESQLQEIEMLGAGGIQAAQKEFFNRQADILRTSEPNSASSLQLGQQAAAEALRKQRSELQREVLSTERQAEGQQLQELAQLKAEQKQRDAEIKKSVGNFMSLGLVSGQKAVETSERNKQLLGTEGTYGTPASIEETLRAKGLNDDQIKKILDEMQMLDGVSPTTFADVA